MEIKFRNPKVYDQRKKLSLMLETKIFCEASPTTKVVFVKHFFLDEPFKIFFY